MEREGGGRELKTEQRGEREKYRQRRKKREMQISARYVRVILVFVLAILYFELYIITYFYALSKHLIIIEFDNDDDYIFMKAMNITLLKVSMSYESFTQILLLFQY